MSHAFADIAFAPAVQAAQQRDGSRAGYARSFGGDGEVFNDRLGEPERAFIAAQRSLYLATVSETGWPYVQHRGGPRGFLKVLDDRTLGFAEQGLLAPRKASALPSKNGANAARNEAGATPRRGFATKWAPVLVATLRERTCWAGIRRCPACPGASLGIAVRLGCRPNRSFRVASRGANRPSAGNRQFISVGNLAANDRVALMLMDYTNRVRLKLLGRLRITELADDEALARQLVDPAYRAKPQRAMRIHVEGFDWNCPQHIPLRFDAEDVQQALDARDARIAALEARLTALGHAPA